MQPIIPIRRKDPFDDPSWLFELKLDGFRGIADTIQGRMLSKNLNPLKRFQHLLDALPPGLERRRAQRDRPWRCRAHGRPRYAPTTTQSRSSADWPSITPTL